MFATTRKTIASVSLSIGLMILSPPAEAYYWGYSPYGAVGSWLWPVSSILSPLRWLGYGYGYSNPYNYNYNYGNGYGYGYNPGYMANSLLGVPLFRPNFNPPNMQIDQYQHEEPLNAPTQRVRGKRPSPTPVDQRASAQWPKSNPNAAQQSTPPVVGQGAPGLAGNTPLASGFVDLVNTKFHGDISEALFDPETRSWARAIGLVDTSEVFDANLSHERIELIDRVFKDRSLDPVRKIETVKVLLRR